MEYTRQIDRIESNYEDVMSATKNGFDNIDHSLGQVTEFLETERRFKSNMLA